MPVAWLAPPSPRLSPGEDAVRHERHAIAGAETLILTGTVPGDGITVRAMSLLKGNLPP